MNKMVVLTKSAQVDGFRLAGVNAIGVDDPEAVEEMIISWLKKKEEILLALDDGLFSMLNKELLKQIYASDEMILVTIPDGPVTGVEKSQKQQVFDMIRHATGVQIKFKGEGNGE